MIVVALIVADTIGGGQCKLERPTRATNYTLSQIRDYYRVGIDLWETSRESLSVKNL